MPRAHACYLQYQLPIPPLVFVGSEPRGGNCPLMCNARWPGLPLGQRLPDQFFYKIWRPRLGSLRHHLVRWAVWFGWMLLVRMLGRLLCLEGWLAWARLDCLWLCWGNIYGGWTEKNDLVSAFGMHSQLVCTDPLCSPISPVSRQRKRNPRLQWMRLSLPGDSS